jgi:hypothetical protein
MIELRRISGTGMNERVDLILPLGFEGAQNTSIFAVGGVDAAKLRGCSSVVTWVVARFNEPCKREWTKTVSLYR